MPLFFVHIPKTAGTSFRLGAEQAFGKSRIVYDYGKASPETGKLTQALLYETKQPDFYAFGQACIKNDTAMVGGHVNAGRFVSLFGVDNALTFLREPLQRMASEYAHFARHYDYKGSFHDFYSRPVMHNRQSKMIHGVDLEALGFVGLNERYSESLAVLNARYGIEVPAREDNRGKQRLDATHRISDEDTAELERLNQRDIALYRRAAALFEQRYDLHQQDKPWAHARLVEATTQRIAGWAWWETQSHEPVEVDVWVNDKKVKCLSAVDLRPGLCRLRPPRGGYVGFQLPVTLKAGDSVQCRVVQTGQRFPLKPATIAEPNTK